VGRFETERELRVFSAFAEAAELTIVPGTIQKRQPPEPDVSCEIVGRGSVAFELVEVVDPGLAAVVGDQIRLQGALHRASRESPAGLNSFADALVFVRFQRKAGVLKREAAIPGLFQLLRSLPPRFAGDLAVPAGTGLFKTVRALRVTRGNFPPGPHFQVEAGRWLRNPVLECLRSKFTKRYSSSSSIELLAYYELHPSGLAEMHNPAVRDYVAANIRQSPFDRVWVYAADTKIVLYDSAQGATAV
jgi:hypothetical protein